MMPPPTQPLSWASLALRVCLVGFAYKLNQWGSSHFGAIRATCTFACEQSAGLYAAIPAATLVVMLGALPAITDTLWTRIIIRAGTLYFLAICYFGQTVSHAMNVKRVWLFECTSLYESELACYGSLARNGLGVAIGISCTAVLIVSFVRSCLQPPPVQRDVWWLWLALRIFLIGIGINIMVTCPAIAVGDVAFRQSPDYLSFVMVAGPTYLGAGILATHERREQFDTLLMLHGLFDQQGANQNGMF